jgi:hypothetical protein
MSISAVTWFPPSSHFALKVGTISATGNGRTIFIINGVGGKLYWAYSLTDESTDGRSKVRSKDAAEMKARLKQEFKGWDLALKILEVFSMALCFVFPCNT